VARIAILGAGVMGSAMAVPAGALGSQVDLVGTHLDGEIVRSVAGNGWHPRLGLTLPETTRAHDWTRWPEVVAQNPDLIVLGVASAGVDWAIDRLAEALTGPTPILMITKGLHADGERIEALPLRVAREVQARTGFAAPVFAVGGPCIAGELAAQRDTRVVVTGENAAAARAAASLFGAPFYHAQASADVIGVEVCAAFKNFYALAVGAAAGRLEREGKASNGAAMHNVAAGLFAQAVAEMAALCDALGGDRDTAAGLAGAGDLYVTCLAGRNSRMGRLLGLGRLYSEAKASDMAADTVEGAELARALGPTLERMAATGRLPGEKLPLMAAVLDAVNRDKPMVFDFAAF
jgi:glycerol-3-phosphate dehydrogenase (NAD(P)+)